MPARPIDPTCFPAPDQRRIVAGQLGLGVGDQPHPHHAGVSQAIAEPIDQAREMVRTERGFAPRKTSLAAAVPAARWRRRSGGSNRPGRAVATTRTALAATATRWFAQAVGRNRPTATCSGSPAVHFKRHSRRMAPRPARVSMAARRRTRCSNAASIVSRRAVGNSADQRTSNCGGGSQAGSGSGKPARHAVQAIQQLRPEARRKLAPRQGFQLLDPPDAQAMQQRHDRFGQAEGFEGKSGERRRRAGKEGRGDAETRRRGDTDLSRVSALRFLHVFFLRTMPVPTLRRACGPRRHEAASPGRAVRRGSAGPAPLRRRTNGRHS